VRNVAALPSIPLLAGCACGLTLDHPYPLLSSLALICSIALAIWALAGRRARALSIAVVAGFFAGGVQLAANRWAQAWRTPLRIGFEQLAVQTRVAAEQEGRRLPLDDEVAVMVEGVLGSDAAPSANGVSVVVDVEAFAGLEEPRGLERSTRGRVLLTITGSLASDRMEEWRAGRRVRMPALLRRPARYLNPGVPDGERALARRGITLVGTVKSGALVEVRARGSSWSEALAGARAFARRAIRAAVARRSPQSGAIVAAIVIGDRSTLDDAVQTKLQEAGTYHVIAISGGNIAILAGLLLTAFRVAGWFGRSAMGAAILLLLIYAAFVGGGASVERATLMAVLYLGARLFDQRTAPLNALALTAALLTLADPLSVVDPAFLLTFGATLAILVVVPQFDWRRLPKPFAFLGAMLAASAAAELVLFPVGALVFARVTLAGLVLNFVAIPLMSIAQVAGMLVLPLALVAQPLATLAGWAAHIGSAGLIASADLVQFAPFVTWRLAPPPALVVTTYYAALAGTWFTSARIGRIGSKAGRTLLCRRWCVGAAAAAALWIAIDPPTLAGASGDGRLHVTFIDVGQGDAAFVVFPRGATLLVDAGGLGFSSAFDVGARVVAPVIRTLGFRRIDRMTLTHGDPDHVGGAAAIIREFRPTEVWEGIPVPRSDALTALRRESDEQRGRWANVYAGDRLTLDGVDVVALHPDPPEWERQKVRNEDSLVLELRWRDVSVVLTGDIGRVSEQRLMPAFSPARVRVIKVPHHGSLTSSSAAFVRALAPTVAIVSVGRSNHYGHPAPEVLERYRSAGARIFRTDRDGAVTFETDGSSYSVTTFVGHEGTKEPWWDWPRRHEDHEGATK
jgi:competence protein ComEC